ncbi:hypothetical protein [Catenovulum sediminis]|uniref:Histidine kinase/HSP90-like ATPase domain-containing protein n=1 Tax=Catenovulum sediminis TaxID=1740262 RepID=A0ABV1RMZ5_9ALTE
MQVHCESIALDMPAWQLLDKPEVLSHTKIVHELDVFDARRDVLKMALSLGFRNDQAYSLVTAMTELGNNIVFHSVGGYLLLQAYYALHELTGEQAIVALMLIAQDSGPGIADIELAKQEGYSSINSMGCGLSGVFRLMDACRIESFPSGTRVTATLYSANGWER